MAKFGKFDMRVLQLNHSHYASRFAVTHNNVFVNYHAKGDGGTMIVRRSLRGMNRPQRIGGIRPRGGERPKIGGTGVELRIV